MKTCLTISLILLCCTVYAQTDSLAAKYEAALQNIELKKLDSLGQAFTKQSDSIRNEYTGSVQKLVLLKQRYALRIDSIRNKKPSTPGNPLDTLGTAADVSRYTQKMDSLDRQLSGVQQKTTAKLDSLKGRVSQKISSLKLPKGAEGKVNGLTEAMDKVDLPSFNSDLAARTGLNINTGLPDISGNLPGAGIPDIPAVNTNVPGMDMKAPDLKSNFPSTNLNTEKLSDITGQAGSLQQQVKEATASQEALGNALEGKAAEQIKGLPEQKLPDAAGLPGGVPKTGDEAKEQLVNMAKKEAVNHFAGKEAVLTNAMEKMSKYKQKYSSVNSLKDLKDEKHHNELKGKPLRERLVPALTLQFQSWQDFMLDINPSVGYKLNPKILVGLGWNQRIAFNASDRTFNRYSNVHGIRSYGEYTLKKGFGIRLDLECMNTPLKNRDLITDAPPQRDWVWSALVGIKQRYPIYKKLKGNAQFMYNVFDKDHRSPYTDRLNWRIGLEFTVKKKK